MNWLIWNPSPTQWKRMKELQKKMSERTSKLASLEEEKSRKGQEEKDRLRLIDQLKREKEADHAAIQSWLDMAASWDKAGDGKKADEARGKAEAIRRSMKP